VWQRELTDADSILLRDLVNHHRTQIIRPTMGRLSVTSTDSPGGAS